MSVTCAICETQIDLIPDGKLRYCQCKALGIDHTKEYTRYLGTIPKEDPDFEEWWRRHHKSCLRYREIWQKS